MSGWRPESSAGSWNSSRCCRSRLTLASGLSLALAFAGAGCHGGPRPDARPAPAEAKGAPAEAKGAPAAGPLPSGDGAVELLFTAEVHNATAPCGCTSDPLGDVARLAHLVRARGDRALLLDGGGLLYDEQTPAARQTEARLKATFLAQTFGALKAVGTLQPEDLQQGTALPAGPERVASNVDLTQAGAQAGSLQGSKPWALRTVGPVRIGVLGVLPVEGAWPPAAVAVRDPRQALPAQIQALRQAGAQIVVALTGLPRPQARRLARLLPGLDVVLVGDQVEDGTEEPEQVVGPDGQPGAVLLMPAKEARRVVRLSLWRYDEKTAPGPLRLVPGAALRLRLTRQLARAQALQQELEADARADPSFLATTRAEVARLQAELRAAQASAPPAQGPYVTAELLPLSKAVAQDPGVVAGMKQLDRAIGEENLKQVKGPPPAPLPGQPRYVGASGCMGSCHWHEDAFKLWQGTHHASAWQTLVEGGKTLSLECVGCHATAFGELGGANLRTLWTLDSKDQKERPEKEGPPGPDLRAIGCEACHGPGSLHATAKSPAKVPVPVPRPKAERCRDCHTRDHSDTFDPVPYLRDILGKGHGEEVRAALGPGVTGRELRTAALRRAAVR